MCERKEWPSPRFSNAPSTRPGMSATLNSAHGDAGALTEPSCGCSVVNGYSATCGVAREIAASSDDLPAFGKPTRPTSATVLSVSASVACSPGRPSSASLELCSRPDRSVTLPRPPAPPAAITTSSPS